MAVTCRNISVAKKTRKAKENMNRKKRQLNIKEIASSGNISFDA